MEQKKDAYWFSHDSNAKDDPKCMLLIDQLGLEGYGIYWLLIETLRDQPDYKYPLVLLPVLGKRYQTSAEKMKAVVLNYELFKVENDKFFFSPSLNNRMKFLENKREQTRQAGLKSAEKRKKINGRSTDVQRTFNGSSTSKVKYNTEQNNTIQNNKVNSISDKNPIKFSDLENTQWFESIIRFLQFKTTSEDLEKYWKQYQDAMIADDDLYRDPKDYRAHFRNWVKIQIEKQNNQQTGIVKPFKVFADE